MDPVFLGNIESLKMDSPDVHRINFGPEVRTSLISKSFTFELN